MNTIKWKTLGRATLKPAGSAMRTPAVLTNWANIRSPLGIGLGAVTTLGGGRGRA